MADQSRVHSGEGKSASAFLARMDAVLGSGDVLDVRRFEIVERMSGLFEARLRGVSDNPDIDFEATVGQALRCTAHGREGRTWTGVCADIHQVAVEEHNLSTYEVTLVPALWLATQRRNHRMFQQMSEIDIVLELLGEWVHVCTAVSADSPYRPPLATPRPTARGVEDGAGRELLRMQAEKDLHKLVKNDERSTTGHDRTRVVHNDEQVTIGNNRTKVVQNDEQATVGNNRTRLVNNDESVTVGNNRTRLVNKDEHVTIGNNRTKVVQNDESVTIGNDHTRHVKNSESVTIGKDLVSMVMASAREVTALSKNVTVGVNRATQIGMIDSTTVGDLHLIMVSPAGEGDPGPRTTKALMRENTYEMATSGGATVALDNRKIKLEANGNADEKPKAAPPAKAGAKGAPPAKPAPPAPNSTLTIEEKKIALDVNKKASITMIEDKIVLASAAGAKITIHGKNITIEAAHGGDIIIKGGPMVRVNPP